MNALTRFWQQFLARPGTGAFSGILAQLTAVGVALLAFGLFIAAQGKSPFGVLADMFTGSFGSWFAIQNSLVRAAPLLLCALCTLIPAQLGMVIIGNEGAWLIGGLTAAASATVFGGLPPLIGIPLVLLAGAIGGAVWIGLVGLGRQWRGLDPTIASLLMYYVALGLFLFLVEGPLRDPASLNKPSTQPLVPNLYIENIPGTSLHVGLIIGLIACGLVWWVLYRTRLGFNARITGGNERVASTLGLPRGLLIVGACAVAGACAGLAGGIEVAAVHRSANASLQSGTGFAGILVAFVARQHPLAVIPVAILLGGIQASGGLIQRRHDIPDATIAVFQGLLFVAVLLAEAFRREPEAKS